MDHLAQRPDVIAEGEVLAAEGVCGAAAGEERCEARERVRRRDQPVRMGAGQILEHLPADQDEAGERVVAHHHLVRDGEVRQDLLHSVDRQEGGIEVGLGAGDLGDPVPIVDLARGDRAQHVALAMPEHPHQILDAPAHVGVDEEQVRRIRPLQEVIDGEVAGLRDQGRRGRDKMHLHSPLLQGEAGAQEAVHVSGLDFVAIGWRRDADRARQIWQFQHRPAPADSFD